MPRPAAKGVLTCAYLAVCWILCRVVLIALLRIAIATVPSQRTAKEGDAVLLARPATPGLAGAAQDWLRLLAGRVQAPLPAPVSVPVPPCS